MPARKASFGLAAENPKRLITEGTSMTNLTINNLPKYLKPAAKFVRHKEQAAGLSTSRFIQDFSVCMIPKATFSRSIPDLCENVFLEGSEESLI